MSTEALLAAARALVRSTSSEQFGEYRRRYDALRDALQAHDESQRTSEATCVVCLETGAGREPVCGGCLQIAGDVLKTEQRTAEASADLPECVACGQPTSYRLATSVGAEPVCKRSVICENEIRARVDRILARRKIEGRAPPRKRDLIARAFGWNNWAEVERDSQRDGYLEAGGRGAMAAHIGRTAHEAQELIDHVTQFGPDEVALTDETPETFWREAQRSAAAKSGGSDG